jgi:hypothetical protein
LLLFLSFPFLLVPPSSFLSSLLVSLLLSTVTPVSSK